MELAIIAAVAIVGYAIFASQNANAQTTGQPQGGFLSPLFSRSRTSSVQPVTSYTYNPNETSVQQEAQQGVSLAGSAAAGGLAIAGLGAAATGVGLGVAAGIAVWSAITAHHKQAVAKEGRGMAVAIPHWNQGLAILVQSAASGRYGRQAPLNTGLMEADLNQLYSDYKTVVGPIIKGSPNITPPHAVWQPKTASYHITSAVWAGGANPCNGPCSYAKNYIAPQWNQALQSMIWAARGIHAKFVIPALQPDSAKQFPGAAGVEVDF